MHKAYILKGLFYYPAIFSLIYNLFAGIEWAFVDFAENVLFISIVLIISFLVPFYKGRLIFLITNYLLITFSALVETGYYTMYHSKLNMSVIYILLETNTSETSEFISAYFNLLLVNFVFLIIPLIIILPLIVKWNWSIEINKKRNFQLKNISFGTLSVVILLLILGFTKIHTYNTVYTASKAYIQYRKEMKSYDQYAFNPFGGKFTDIRHNYKGKEIYIVVIGESANRDHHSLYNYYRKTNQELEGIKSELTIYQDVISPHANTIESLPKILSYGSYENPDAKFDGLITQLFNQTGFQTYWISNQEPLGLHETSITRISKASSKRYFTNTISNRKRATYDNIILQPFTDILKDSLEKKFIIVQLLGSHADYSKRYPRSHKVFSGKTKSTFVSPRADDIVNAYDNSILYTDKVISQIINEVKKENCRSFVLYLSDHGEDVFKTSDKAYHAEGVKSKHMFEIPFILWKSIDVDNESDSLVFDINRPFMTDDLFYSLCDLARINYKEMCQDRSLFNMNFGKRKRIILGDIDYDEQLKNKLSPNSNN